MTRHQCVAMLAVIVAVEASWIAGVAPAAAQETGPRDDDEARVHFRLGQAYYESGRFDDAAREFETAYRLSGRAELLYNIFVACRDAGRLAPAVEALREYLARVPDVRERPQLEARLRAMTALLESQGSAGAAPITSDSGATSERPTEAAGSGEIATRVTSVAGASGSAATVEPDVHASPEAAHDASAAAAPESATVAPSSDGGGGISPIGIAITAVGGAAMIAGAITGGVALSDRSSLDELCQADGRCPPGFEETRDRGNALAITTDALLIGGGVVAATGVVLMLVLDGGGDREGEPQASAMCGPTGCAVSLAGQF